MLVNRSTQPFKKRVNSKYIDKTGFLSKLNNCIKDCDNFICVVRPRRFGKTITANMINAYYSKGSDTSDIFDKLKISQDETYHKYLNKYDTVYINMNNFVGLDDPNGDKFLSKLVSTLLKDLKNTFPKAFVNLDENPQVESVFQEIIDVYGNQFVFIIDEWDCIFRVYENNTLLQQEYAKFLTSLFKSQFAEDGIALAYMTGILPIKRYSNQSLFNNFREITMLKTYGLGEYMGFTEGEVKDLCEQYDIDFAKTKYWYDGYRLDGFEIYNPYAITELISSKVFDSTWSNTASNVKIINKIRLNFDGLREDLASLINGEALFFELPSKSSNALYNLDSKQAIFACLIYLGYFAFNADNNAIFIPNEDVRRELIDIFLRDPIDDDNDIVSLSKRFFEAIISHDSKQVASIIEYIHDNLIPKNKYNSEDSLRSVMMLAFVYAQRMYKKPVAEMPAGKGFADLILEPRADYLGKYPAMVVELKWNRTAQDAINQIKDRHYQEALDQYRGDVLLVGINYDEKSKKHDCIIEKQ